MSLWDIFKKKPKKTRNRAMINRTGKRSGCWIVIAQTKSTTNQHSKYTCQCLFCGVERTVDSYTFYGRKTPMKTCKCLDGAVQDLIEKMAQEKMSANGFHEKKEEWATVRPNEREELLREQRKETK